MASGANTVAIILDPDQGVINLGHLAAVPGGDTIEKSYSPLVRGVIQPLGVVFNLMSLGKEMSESFLDFHASASQPCRVSWLNIARHRSSLLPLQENPVKERINHQHVEIYRVRGPRSVSGKWYTNATIDLPGRKKDATTGRFIFCCAAWIFYHSNDLVSRAREFLLL
jgi:hypothetical protein